MPEKSNRRHFLKIAAASSIFPAVAVTPAAAGPVQPQAETPAAPTAAQGLTDYVRARFGKNLNAEQIKRVQQQLEGLVRSADALGRAQVDVAEEPALVFVAEPEE
jgi:hypothetical protein